MEITMAHSHSSAAAGCLLQHYQEAALDPYSPYDTWVEEARRFMASAKPSVEEVRQLGYLVSPDVKVFTFPDNWAKKDRYRFADGLGNFCKAVYDVATNRKMIFPDDQGVRRKPLPDLDAFRYEGHNDVNISNKPSNYLLSY